MDAGAFHCPSCGAAISENSVQCRYCQALLQTVACPSCFGMIFKGSRFCPRCGARTDPHAARDAGRHHCPHCKRANLHALTVAGTQLEQCGKCGGLWVQTEHFEEICSNREAQAAALGIRLPPAPELDQKVRYRKCPQCTQLMNRMNYAARSGIVIDICRPHGVWFDRDELTRIIEFIRAGGLDRSRKIEKEQLERERRRLESQQLLGPAGGYGTLPAENYDAYLQGNLIAGIGSVLINLLKR